MCSGFTFRFLFSLGGLFSIRFLRIPLAFCCFSLALVWFPVGSRVSPFLIAMVGHVRVFAALASLISAAFIGFAIIVDPLAWFILRVIVGLCFAGVYVASESWLNEAATNANRGKTMSIYLSLIHI